MIIDDFFWRALLAGIGVALITGPLGCFIVWRRMAYFGDALSHAALLGVALGFLLDLDPTLGVAAVTSLIAVILALFQGRKWISNDTLLGILAHAFLAMGLVAISLMAWLRIDLMGYLFGDILAVSLGDALLIWCGGAGILGALAFLWRPLLALTVHEDMARAEGVPAERIQLAFMILIALMIAMAMKIVGILLITALLIIPAAAARRFSQTPEGMAAGAALLGSASVASGLFASLTWDTPSGPSVVVAAGLLFMISLVRREGRARHG